MLPRLGLVALLVLMAPLGAAAQSAPPSAASPGAGPAAAAAAAPAVDPAAAAPFKTFELEVMATRFEVRLPDRQGAGQAIVAVFKIFQDVDARMSEWKDTSPLSRVNNEAGRSAVAVPADLRAVVARGLSLSEATDGAFDITWAALWGLWDFRADVPALPDRVELARRVALVDYRQVAVDDDAGTVELKKAGMKLGLGGIAKGWALDRAAEELRARGFSDFLLSGGGQVYAAGSNGGRPWGVGVRDPRGAADDFFASLQAEDVSVSTSGDYERFFVIDGVRYHHILDTKTGMPARGVVSATTVSADATLADAMSTALIVMGWEKGIALVEATAGLEALVVDNEGGVHVTSGLVDSVRYSHPPSVTAP